MPYGWAVGTILAKGDEAVDEDQLKAYVDKGYKRFDIPAVPRAVCTQYPFNSISVYMALRSVFPKLAEFNVVGENLLRAFELDRI